jgi:signal transduction histidine kinase/DNA-binding response OmpR family regulator/streptogramin lyase
VQAISDDPDGGLWLGTDRGLWHFDSGSREFEARSREADTEISVDSTSIRCLLTDAAGDVWIGTIGRGLYRRDRSTGRLIQFTNDPSVPGSLSQDIIIALDQDHLGRVWIGTDSRGVDLFEPSSGSFRHFYDPALGLSTVVDILEDSRGRIWLATLAGLFQIDPEEGVVAVFDSLKGLPNDMIAGVLEDERGRLWLSTGRGLAWLDPESGRVGIFDSADGLHSDQIYYAHCRLSDGRMVFGANRGLVFFDPARAQPCAFVPPVVITGVAVADRPLAVGGESPLQHPPFLADELVLGAQQNDLSLTFSALDFARPGKNRYRYRLVPYDSSWRDSGPGHKAVYTNLDPGSYLFRVQGSNMDGLWNEDGASLRIVIRPPWWRTAWAIGLYVLAMCILLWTGHRLLLTRQRMRDELRLQQEGARQLQELDELKSRLFANISHEIRTPLTIIRGQLERLFASLNGADREVVAMVVRNAERLGHLLDQLLDLSRLDAGKLPLEWQRDEDLGALRRLVSTFDPLALLRDITLVMDISDQPMTVWIEPDVLDKVVGNLLGNALKYTPSGGDVRVTAVWDQSVKWVVAEGTARVRAAPGGDAEGAIRARTLIVSVANSGSFIPSDQMDRVFERFHQMHTQGSNLEGSGIGLALVKELLEVIGGSVTVESSKTAGTKFIARLPCLAEEPVDGRRRDPLGERELLQSGREPLRKVRTVERASEITVEEEGDTVMMRPLLLLVEDHPDMRAYMRDVLASTYRLIEAPDGEQALPLAVSESPDLIVSDVMMPGMDGFDLCRRLAATTSTSHIPVILLTALADSQSRREGLQAGAVEYLSKPFDAEELRVRIRNLLERQWRLSERLTRLILEVERPVLPGETSDERYLRRLRQAVDHNLDDPLLRVEDLCREIDTSRSQLHRKLKTLTGMTATAFIRQHRLMRAAELLAGGHDYVTGVAYAVGFRSLSYFARSFREQYGVLPSEYEGNPTIGT